MLRSDIARRIEKALRVYLMYQAHTIFVEETHLVTAVPYKERRRQALEQRVRHYVLFPDVRADFFGWYEADGANVFTIYEVKSCWDDFRFDEKWHQYLPYCHKLYFVVNEDFPIERLTDPRVGIMCTGGRRGCSVVRRAPVRPIPDHVDMNRLKFLVARRLYFQQYSRRAVNRDLRQED